MPRPASCRNSILLRSSAPPREPAWPAAGSFISWSRAALGGLFAWLDPDLPGDSLRQRGIILAAIAWLLMMFFVMPLAGAGFLGLNHGVLMPLATLALHMIFGAVMGGTYGWLILQAVPLRYRQPRGT